MRSGGSWKWRELVVKGKPSIEEYDEAFRRLSLIESAQSWWWGDLANSREKHYGSLKELSERLGLDYSSLQKYQWVSSRYEMLTRVNTLSFRHHMIAAPLEDRLEWLKKALEEGWSARTLELEIKKARRSSVVLPEGKYNVIYADPP